MKFYFSTRQIPALRHLPLTQRLQQVQLAQAKLTGPEKLLLNVLKLVILIPIFVLILRSGQEWTSLLWAFLVATAFPLLLKPLQYGLCNKYLSSPTQKES
ncbi:DUF6170 family protein [Aliiglaciecola sp. CAU 1673]|uniref:DUF6170 family protein n=1 Tax=Aliiglaciecola sp. CAU 1673 TaxID=3032595 RepID=UPI0023DAED03|nr:DUF6170 family protein [Aliiglaciecola sp. CAU 1673]MDF2177498.1 DUF6170 family protein [Aliiglaciecola sp. CAU 1673]